MATIFKLNNIWSNYFLFFRAHCIFTITVEQQDGNQCLRSKIAVVDVAGTCNNNSDHDHSLQLKLVHVNFRALYYFFPDLFIATNYNSSSFAQKT